VDGAVGIAIPVVRYLQPGITAGTVETFRILHRDGTVIDNYFFGVAAGANGHESMVVFPNATCGNQLIIKKEFLDDCKKIIGIVIAITNMD
jgi:hypothetical protein